MSQSFYQIEQALDTRLLTVTGITTANLITENKGSDLSTIANPTGMVWVRPTLVAAKTTVETLGANGYIKPNGFYAIDVVGLLNQNYTQVKQLADLIMAAFPPGLILTLTNGDKLQIDVASPSQNVTEGSWSMNKYYATQVMVDWFVYTTP
jgi:hypothetical protein